MEHKIVHGVICVRRGEFFYRVKRPISRTDYWASRQKVGSNWREFDSVTLGNNKVIINQRN